MGLIFVENGKDLREQMPQGFDSCRKESVGNYEVVMLVAVKMTESGARNSNET